MVVQARDQRPAGRSNTFKVGADSSRPTRIGRMAWKVPDGMVASA
jgi:hypothetical protein